MASGPMADFARLPPQRKVLVFVVIGGLLGLGYWKLSYKALEEDLEAAQAEHDEKVATNKRLAGDIPKYEELRAQTARMREVIEKNQTALPSAPELPAFFETLQHKVAESGVEIGKWSKRNEESIESFIKVPVDIEISGTFLQIKRFFASLIQRDVRPHAGTDEQAQAEDRERIVSIENLALTSPTARNRDVILNAKFTAVTFRQEDPGARPPGSPAPGGAKPAAPPPRPAAPVTPPTPPPPMPSTGTPAGAKAQVEDAIDRGAARSAGAAAAADGKTTAGDRLKGGL